MAKVKQKDKGDATFDGSKKNARYRYNKIRGSC
ncbi:MAG: hypothetical protein C5S38_06565 [Candidatus Methanophagaceae archaeon]|nr:MAG: hypothetical protein C5S38_06565 [Methanophagales archaeon]